MKNLRKLLSAAALCGAVLSVLPAFAQEGGTAPAPAVDSQAATDVGRIRWFRVYGDSALFSGGTGLRNRADGAIEISGIPAGATVRRGWLYWDIITYSQPTTLERTLYIQRLSSPRSGRRAIVGTVIGQGASPCWGGTYNTVLRAWVGSRIINGNGTYGIQVPDNTFGRTDGSLPWGNVTFPLINGASLFVVTSGSGNVALYDAPMAGQMFYSYNGLTVSLRVPPGARNYYHTNLHFANSDGQYGNPGLFLSTPVAIENVLVNGVNIAGPLSTLLTDGDWNGRSGGSYAQLWDHVVHSVDDHVPYGSARIDITHAGESTGQDCLVPVAVGVERY